MTLLRLMQMIETQAELRAALAKIKELEQNMHELEVQKNQLESKLSQTDSSDESKLVEDLKIQVFIDMADYLKAIREFSL